LRLIRRILVRGRKVQRRSQSYSNTEAEYLSEFHSDQTGQEKKFGKHSLYRHSSQLSTSGHGSEHIRPVTSLRLKRLIRHSSRATTPHPASVRRTGYRAAWAGPIQPVEEWDASLVAAHPEIAKPFLQSVNTTGAAWEQEHKPANMKTEARGLNSSRWGDR
jgi:hypothetical protein